MSRAEVTKARILQAATDEFAAHGIAGARVDRIAKAASVNKNLLYVYLENKDRLFDAVFEARITLGLEQVPFTPDDLPVYAAAKLDSVAAAQRNGVVGATFTPATLLPLVVALATAWGPVGATSLPARPRDADERDEAREAIVEAVRRLVQPQ
jgi:AcrR family transcriptional regulator